MEQFCIFLAPKHIIPFLTLKLRCESVFNYCFPLVNIYIFLLLSIIQILFHSAPPCHRPIVLICGRGHRIFTGRLHISSKCHIEVVYIIWKQEIWRLYKGSERQTHFTSWTMYFPVGSHVGLTSKPWLCDVTFCKQNVSGHTVCAAFSMHVFTTSPSE